MIESMTDHDNDAVACFLQLAADASAEDYFGSFEVSDEEADALADALVGPILSTHVQRAFGVHAGR